MLGVLIPLTASSIFFREPIAPIQWVGICVLFIAVVIMCSYNNTIKARMTLPALILLRICGAANGVADFSQKLFTKCIPGGSAAAFNFYTYVFAALVLMAAYGITHKRAPETKKSRFEKDLRICFYNGAVPVCKLLFQNIGRRILKCRFALSAQSRVRFDPVRDHVRYSFSGKANA